MVHRFAAAVLLVSVVWIGLCVVYLGVHWMTDVVAGWLLGGGIGVAAAWLAGRWRRSSPAAGSE